MTLFHILNRLGVAYYDCLSQKLSVLEVWEGDNELFGVQICKLNSWIISFMRLNFIYLNFWHFIFLMNNFSPLKYHCYSEAASTTYFDLHKHKNGWNIFGSSQEKGYMCWEREGEGFKTPVFPEKGNLREIIVEYFTLCYFISIRRYQRDNSENIEKLSV